MQAEEVSGYEELPQTPEITPPRSKNQHTQMTCTSPFTLTRSDGLCYDVPCGQCTACRIARAREWATRCLHELPYWGSSSFVTLTYDEEHKPPNSSLRQKDLTDFFKRLRHHFNFRYYACGEYGEHTERPHYHIILFGAQPCTCNVRPDKTCHCTARSAIIKTWPHGLVDRLGTVTYQSARYVADYIGKSFNGHLAEVVYDQTGRERPFSAISKGLGKRWAQDNHEQLKSLKLTLNGVQVSLPRYYIDILNLDTHDIRVRPYSPTPPSKTRSVWIRQMPAAIAAKTAPRKQRAANTEARLRNFKKGHI